MNWTPSRVGALSGLLLLPLGCVESEAPSADFSVTDSGTAVVVRIGSLDALSAPALAPEVVFRTSATGVELFGVTAGRLLEDGRVVVGNAGNGEVLLLQATGEVDRIVGRAGEGPGEFGTISTIHRTEGGGFTVYDTRIGRWTHYDAAGEVSSTMPMLPPDRSTDLTPLTLGAGGELLAIYGARRRMPGEGIQRDTTPLLRYATRDASPDTLGGWGMRETSFERRERGWGATPVGFGRSLAFFGTDRWAVLGDTDRLDITLFDGTGEVKMTLRGGGTPIPTKTADGEQWREDMLESLGPDIPESLRESIVERVSRASWRESYPAFDDLAVDVTGDVWVGTTATFGQAQRRWLIFGPDGIPRGALTLPVGAQILDATSSHVLTLERDDLDVEDLALWQIHGLEQRGGGA